MWLVFVTAAIVGVPHQNSEMLVPAAGIDVTPDAAGFEVLQSPYSLGGSYLARTSPGPGAGEAVMRVPVPPGTWYAYVAWMRSPRGATDVRIRVPGHEATVDQSRLANGASPDDFPRDDMADYDGLCGSGLCRVTDAPTVFGQGDCVEVAASDAVAGTVTTVDYVLLSPYLYLDDLGNDARLPAGAIINLRNYGAHQSGQAGFGLAFTGLRGAEGILEWTLPADGLFLLSADINRGPSRAERMPFRVEIAGGRIETIDLVGRAAAFGRSGFEPVGVLRAAKGAHLRLLPAEGGASCADLLRLTPLSESALVPTRGLGADRFVLQWEAMSHTKPWLRQVRVAPAPGVCPSPSAPDESDRAQGIAHGLLVSVDRTVLPVLGDLALGLPVPADVDIRVELADDYGYALPTRLLREQPYVWLRDLGMFACQVRDDGTEGISTHRAEMDAQVGAVAAGVREPLLSTSERYFRWTGYDETRPGQDDRAFEFAYRAPRPLLPRFSDAVKRMPEPTYSGMLARVQEPGHRRMFLGWPNVCQEFYVLSSGVVGVSSGSGTGTGHPPAESLTVAPGAGDPPAFPESSDRSARQSIEDGWQLVCLTEWAGSSGQGFRAQAFAYPMAGEDVSTGNEPLACHMRIERTSGARGPLWLRIRPDVWGGRATPLADLGSARLEDGILIAGGRPVLSIQGAGAEVSSASHSEVLLRLNPDSDHADVIVPYIAVGAELLRAARALGFDGAKARMKAYWDRRLARGAVVDVPDPVVADQYKTLYPRTLICGDLDTEGDYALKTSPIVYDLVWLHATSYGIEGLARRGHFEEAKHYLEAGFRWQGSQASDAYGEYTDWAGFFTAPPRYTAALWLNYHGWFQWAAARYFLFSDDRYWLGLHLPALARSLDWTAAQRRQTMHGNPDGTRPVNWGWLPPGRVTDGSAGTSTFTDCINWMGFNEVVRVLERIGDPRAAHYRREADDYRACILRGLRLAARTRPVVRLNDGTYVPYVPGYLESQGREEGMWYAAVVDGALEGILDSGVVPRGDPLEDWVASNLEDNLFVMGPNLADEAYFLGHACAYLRRDEPENAVYTLYSVLASHMSPQTLTTFEHRSWGSGRVWELSPWPMGYYTRLLSGMLCYDEGEDVAYLRSTPRAWLDPGKTVQVDGLQTRFGPTSLRVSAERDRIVGQIELPMRYRPASVTVRLRLNGRVTAVEVNGRKAAFNTHTESFEVPLGESTARFEAAVDRGGS